MKEGDITTMLPAEAINKEWHLKWYELPSEDPVFIETKRGQILYQWPENYIPSLTEVFEVCQQLLSEDLT